MKQCRLFPREKAIFNNDVKHNVPIDHKYDTDNGI